MNEEESVDKWFVIQRLTTNMEGTVLSLNYWNFYTSNASCANFTKSYLQPSMCKFMCQQFVSNLQDSDERQKNRSIE